MKLTQIALMLSVACVLSACDNKQEQSHDANADKTEHHDAAASHEAAAPATDSAAPMELKAEDTATDAAHAEGHDAKAHATEGGEAAHGGENSAEATPAAANQEGQSSSGDASMTSANTMDATATEVTSTKAQKNEANMDGSMEASATMSAEHGVAGQAAAMTGPQDEKMKAQAVGFGVTVGESKDNAGGSAQAKGEGETTEGAAH